MTRSEQALVQAESNVQNQDIVSITTPMINRMTVEEKSEQTIKSYVRAIKKLLRFHGVIHPKDLDIDEVLDFLGFATQILIKWAVVNGSYSSALGIDIWTEKRRSPEQRQ